MKKIVFAILILAVFGSIYWVANTKSTENKPADVPAVINDGIYFGFIHQVDIAGEQKLAFDDAVWLSGKEGQDAAIVAGHCTEETRSECLPNDYFIKNEQQIDEYLPLDQNVSIVMKTWEAGDQGIMDRTISLGNFADLINDQSLHWSKLPYNLTVKNGRVAKIAEVYIP